MKYRRLGVFKGWPQPKVRQLHLKGLMAFRLDISRTTVFDACMSQWSTPEKTGGLGTWLLPQRLSFVTYQECRDDTG